MVENSFSKLELLEAETEPAEDYQFKESRNEISKGENLLFGQNECNFAKGQI